MGEDGSFLAYPVFFDPLMEGADRAANVLVSTVDACEAVYYTLGRAEFFLHWAVFHCAGQVGLPGLQGFSQGCGPIENSNSEVSISEDFLDLAADAFSEVWKPHVGKFFASTGVWQELLVGLALLFLPPRLGVSVAFPSDVLNHGLGVSIDVHGFAKVSDVCSSLAGTGASSLAPLDLIAKDVDLGCFTHGGEAVRDETRLRPLTDLLPTYFSPDIRPLQIRPKYHVLCHLVFPTGCNCQGKVIRAAAAAATHSQSYDDGRVESNQNLVRTN